MCLFTLRPGPEHKNDIGDVSLEWIMACSLHTVKYRIYLHIVMKHKEVLLRVCVCVCDQKPQQQGGLGPSWAVASQKKKLNNKVCRENYVSVFQGTAQH